MLLFLTVISLSLIMTAAVQAQNYYVYAAAESEDEVALIRFDGKTAHVEKRKMQNTIAEHLIENKVNVLLGGGRQYFLPQTDSDR